MRERRLNCGSDGIEHVGILSTGELYVDREIATDDERDRVQSEFVAPREVARLKALLALGGAMSDEELLDRLAGRFKRGADLLQWLRATGIATSPRSLVDCGAPPGGDPRSAIPAGAAPSPVSRSFAPGSRFYEVDGVPVALEPAESGPPSVVAADPVRRDFSLDALLRRGVEITPGRFDELAGSFAVLPDPARRAAAPRVGLRPGARLYEVEGVPVALEPAAEGGAVARAFDPSPRYFPLNALARGGAEISREAFDALVAEWSEVPTVALAPPAWPADD